MAEAGLPLVYEDVRGEQFLLTGATGVVRAIYPETHRVDIETEDGSLLMKALVIGPYFPELHTDGEAPSHVGYLHVSGQAEAFCWPMPHRRLLGPRNLLEGTAGAGEPERRYFHTHGYILRWGDITVRITTDNRFVVETEEGDYILLDSQKREIELHAPTVFVGTDRDTRTEYQRDNHYRIVMPEILMGRQAVRDADGLTYLENTLLHLVSTLLVRATAGEEILLEAPLIKLSAEHIVLDPTSIKLGHASATERVMLGDAWMALYNAFVTLFNGHTHSNVQNGPSVSGPPTASTPAMTDALLSDVARVSKTGL
jgi:hypothetical protein